MEEKKVEKTFRNKLMFFPKDILEGVHNLIDKGHRCNAIRTWLKANYKDLKAIDLGTVRRYIRWYKSSDSSGRGANSGSDIGSTLSSSVGDKTTEVVTLGGTKSEILQNLLLRCVSRLNDITVVNKQSPFAFINQDEKIQRYAREIRSTIEVMTRLSDKLEKDEQVLTKRELEAELQDILYAMKRTVDRVCPEKSQEFAKVLEEEVGKK